MRDKNELVWLDAKRNDYWWASEMDGFAFQTEKDILEVSMYSSPIFTDSGSSCVSPSSDAYS
jgi:hypothetical protein